MPLASPPVAWEHREVEVLRRGDHGGTELARLRQIEATAAVARGVIAIGALGYLSFAPRPSRDLLMVAAVLLGASALATVGVLRLPVDATRLRLVGLLVVATDAGLVAMAMLAETTGPEQGLYLAGILVVLEAAVRWGRLGGVALALAMGVALGMVLAIRSESTGGGFATGPLVMRAGLYVAVGVVVGHTVEVLDGARTSLETRLATSDLVAQFALEASRRGSVDSVRLLARMLLEVLGVNRVAVLVRDPTDGAVGDADTREDPRTGRGPEPPPGTTRVVLRPWAVAGYPEPVEALTRSADDTLAVHPRAGGTVGRALQFGDAGGGGPGPRRESAELPAPEPSDAELPGLLLDPHATWRIAVPLRAAGRPLGVLLVQGDRAGTLGGPDRRLLESLAAEVGQILGHVELAEARTRALRALRRVAAAKDEFVAVASHELRTPVTALVGFARILAADEGAVTAEQRRQAVEAVVRQADRLAALVEDLLAVARIDSGSEEARLEPVPLGPLVRDVLDGRGVRRDGVEVVIPDGTAVTADPRLLGRVIGNLLDNASRHAPGPVLIEARGRGDEVELAVADRGPGIPAGEREQIFDRFRRGAGATGDGTGLGLYIVRALVERMGGRIRVEDRCGGGTRFVLVLTSARSGGPESTRRNAAPGGAGSASVR